MRLKASLLVLCTIAAALAGKVRAHACIGLNEQTNTAYILGANKNTEDYSTTLPSLLTLHPDVTPLSTSRNVNLTGVCVSTSNRVYIVGGNVMVPLNLRGINSLNIGPVGISVFDLSNGTWILPITSSGPNYTNPAEYLAAIADGVNGTWLVLYDKVSTGGQTTWWFFNLEQPSSTLQPVIISSGTSITANFTSMAIHNNIAYLFGNPSIYSVDLAQYISAVPNAQSSFRLATFNPPQTSASSAVSLSPPIPEGLGQAVAFGTSKFGFYSYNTSSITIFDIQSSTYTFPFPFPAGVSSSGTDIPSDRNVVTTPDQDFTLVTLPLPTPLLLMSNPATYIYAIFDSSTAQWNISSSKSNPSSPSSPSNSSSPPSTANFGINNSSDGQQLGPIIGGVVGGVAALIIVILALFIWRRRRGGKRNVPPMAVENEACSDAEGNYYPDEHSFAPRPRKSPTDDSLELGPPIMINAAHLPLMSPAPRPVSRTPSASSGGGGHPGAMLVPSIAPPLPAMPSQVVSSTAIGKRPSKTRGMVSLLGTLPAAKSTKQILDYYERGVEVYAAPDAAAVDPNAPADTIILGRFRLTNESPAQPVPYVITRTATDLQNADPVTMRFFASSPQSSYLFRKDAALLHYLDSPHVVVVLSSHELPQGHPYRHVNVTEFCPKSLEQMMLSDPEMITEDPFFLKLAVKSMLQALQWSQNKSIAHLDIHPHAFHHEPGDTTTWKLAEFASARVIEEEDIDWQTILISRFSAPEILLATPGQLGLRVTASMDAWSVGAIIYELHMKTKLFQSVEDAKSKCRAFPADYVVDVEKVESARVRTLLRGLLVVDPKKRMEIDEAAMTWEREGEE
ncbi:hypothetical protein BC936DRAFT_138766 [Jimgerdemannia flammicorona]|uniref:Protein kinase domain-containing protein n=1 Tax=Jimgerdemannia flammicorona TaxID=994334 RepID=A0A433BK32_9FUNG|nr:hypothetical protein BC936DRAFT_138766 [Jimgerdemannia flammicorona]